MTTKICACCGQPFQPRPQVKDQAYCSAPACQRARRQAWQREKLRDEPYYREYLQSAQRAWRVNSVYALKSVSTAIFGSGITRMKRHKNISDEDLLKIMLWTFRISEMRFKYPAKLTIVIHKGKIDQINLLDIKSAKNGV